MMSFVSGYTPDKNQRRLQNRANPMKRGKLKEPFDTNALPVMDAKSRQRLGAHRMLAAVAEHEKHECLQF